MSMELPEAIFTAPFVLIQDHLLSPAQFLLMALVAKSAREGHHVVLVGLEQTYNHYQAILKKWGVNLDTLAAKKLFTFVDGLTNPFAWTRPNPTPAAPSHMVSWSNAQPNDLHSLYELIVARTTSDSGSSVPVSVFVDSLQPLLLADSNTCAAVLGLFQGLYQYVSTLEAGGYLRVTARSDLDDPITTATINQLAFRADAIAFVERLDSGYSTDVHGQISFEIKRQQLKENLLPEKKLHYRITDASVTYFAPGTRLF